MPYNRSPQISNGHRTDHLFSKERQILSGRLFVRPFTAFYPQQTGIIILNTDPHTQEGTHWLAIHFQPKSSTAFYFDTYAQPPPSDLTILSFLNRNCTVWIYNTTSLQGPTCVVCGHYSCLFAMYMDKGYTPQQFV